jgi:hypothetical protein
VPVFPLTLSVVLLVPAVTVLPPVTVPETDGVLMLIAPETWLVSLPKLLDAAQ